MDIKKDVTRAALAGAVVAGGMIGGSTVVNSEQNSPEKLVAAPRGSLVVKFDDGSKLLCPNPDTVAQKGPNDVVGLFEPGNPDLPTQTAVCKGGNQELGSLMPGHEAVEVNIILADGTVLQAVTTNGTVDLLHPMVLANATPVAPGK